PAVADLAARVRQHDIARRVARGLAQPLEDYQDRSQLPRPGDGKQWHGGHLNHIADNRDWPKLAGAIAHATRHETKTITEQLTEPGGDANGKSTRSERRHVRPDDAARAFVREVGE